MQPKKTFTSQDVTHIAALATIPISEDEEKNLAAGFTTTMGVVDQLFNVDVSAVEPTSQVTGLSNITRKDEVDVERMFSQEQALANAKKAHNGFFVVDQVLEEK